MSKKEIKLASGENETITATLTEGVTGTITWESSAPDIVKVENGKIMQLWSKIPPRGNERRIDMSDVNKIPEDKIKGPAPQTGNRAFEASGTISRRICA